MKKSELKSSIKEEIFNMLEDVEQTIKGTQAQKDYNAELAKTAELEKAVGLKEDEDEEPTKSQLKGASKDSVANIANKLQQTTKEMKSTVNKWKTSEGEEKQKLRDKLLKLTNIKKELESML
jgi:hypothetical protein|tara:strand:+ start:47 stop:412 length:366 start_codon:yes stop_codon:yes gene_type:complete